LSETVVELDNIFKTFRLNYKEKSTVFEAMTSSWGKKAKLTDFNALSNVSFSVKKGEMLGIIGHNGSGKSTLLKIICKITEPTKGTVKTKGKIVPFLQLGSGFNPDLTAIENIRMYGMILGISKEMINKKIPDVLRFADLVEFKDVKAKNFSSGMFARLAFSTAVLSNPDILIIDEVLSVGDLAFQQKSFQKFLEFKKSGKTIIYVTHNLNDILKLCDRVLLMYKGYAADIGDPKIIVDKYRAVVEKSSEFHKEPLAEKISEYYRKILQRPPDIIGVLEYVYKIGKGEMKLEEIPEIFRQSPEYKSLHTLKNK